MKNDRVTVLGAGLAGCEAAFQLAERGIAVSLVEMRPHRRSPAHKTDLFGELVCSNSLRSDRLQNGAGLLKEEMRCLKSLIVSVADETRVPAGGALAVDALCITCNGAHSEPSEYHGGGSGGGSTPGATRHCGNRPFDGWRTFAKH